MSDTEVVVGTRFLGVDLAWGNGGAAGPANESGVAVVDDCGRVLRAGWARGLEETIDWINSAAGAGPALLFVDAPLIVTNPAGQRECERQAGQRYGRWKVSANSTNTRSPRLAGVALCSELRATGWAYSDGTDWPPAAGRTMCECYPYTTLVGAPELGYDRTRPRYKRRPKGMPVAVWRPQRATACDELIRRLSSLDAADPPLLLDTHPVTRMLCHEPSPLRDDEYKHREDLIDALICAWTAALWRRHGQARCQLLGLPSSPATGPAATIIAPVRPEQRGAAHGKPQATRPDASVLTRGRDFHQRVQTAFLADLLGADARPEHTITLTKTRNGRVDLLVLPQGEERMAVVVEIKSTPWDELAGHRIRPNLRDHIRQLQRYLDVYIADLANKSGPTLTTDQDGATPAWDSVSGVLLYPKRPADRAVGGLVESTADREALMVVWYDEADWADGQRISPEKHVTHGGGCAG
jgi:predicted RNase H-like nuclease